MDSCFCERSYADENPLQQSHVSVKSLKSPAMRLLVQQLIRANDRDNSKDPLNWPFVRGIEYAESVYMS